VMATGITTEITVMFASLLGSSVPVVVAGFMIKKWMRNLEEGIKELAVAMARHSEKIAAIEERNRWREELCREKHKGE
jgi:hypothetical protein